MKTLQVICLLMIFSLAATCQSSHKAVLTWGASTTSGVTYEVQRASTLSGPFTTIQSGISALTFTDNTVQANTQYCYQVIAQSSNFADSIPNTPVCGSTGKDQAAPAGTLTLTIQ